MIATRQPITITAPENDFSMLTCLLDAIHIDAGIT